MSKKIVVNGRFAAQLQTGVQRYAQEVTSCLGERIQLLAPRYPVKGFMGHCWEQFLLPRRIDAGDLLWSPANTGPLFWPNQVLTIYDTSPLEHPEWYPRSFASYYRFLWPRLARRVRKIITASEFSKARIMQLLDVPDEKIAVIMGGVSGNFLPRSPDAIAAVRQKLDLRDRYVLFVGSSQPRKNLAVLLRAWEIVAGNLQGIALVVAGGTTPSKTSASVRSSAGRVKYVGYVGDDDLAALYSGATVFVYPSLYEGFGLPVLEAMASGVPVVTTRRASLPEVAGDAAVYTDPEDAVQMAGTILDLLGDERKRTSMIEKGHRRAKGFSWQAAAEAHWALFGSLLENDG